MTSYEIVKTWNARKHTRYQVSLNGGSSAIVSQIESMYQSFLFKDLDRYFNAMLDDESITDIWNIARSWKFRQWLKENPPVVKVEEEKKEEEVKVEMENNNILGALGKEIVTLIGSDMVNNIAKQVRDEMDKYISDKTVVKVVEYNEKRNPIGDITHACFEDVLKFVAMNEPVMLVGPAGTGKNVICEQVAKSLGLDFYFTNAVTQEYKLTGYGDAMGNFIETQFYKWAKNGGLFVFDEMDASSPEALIVVNCAIANGYFDFPVVGRVALNENCRIIACANTWGTGASMEYVGRNQLDGATLNRFACMFVDYDTRIENALAGGNNDILDLCRAFRKIAGENGCHIIVSYREINRLHKMIDVAKMDVTTAIKTCLLKGLEKDSLRIIVNQMSSSVAYRKNLLEIVNA